MSVENLFERVTLRIAHGYRSAPPVPAWERGPPATGVKKAG